MGVPAFFRWLSRKYPSIVVHATEERSRQLEDGTEIPVDTSQPNPNATEFDNLYLDMNGIIHPCCHPEDRPAPKNEEEMMVLIFEYIDRIFRICRPRRLLYMAIDGVAPRAKMNQQRSRRFRSSKEVIDKEEEIQKVRQRLEDQGIEIPTGPQSSATKEDKFDSNCITPGTEFMANLAEALRYYIHDRLNNDPGWANISVILSDASVPGEGEHKIMDFIRKQRSSSHHDPNTHHCLCGADADLIMLGLATHEPNFTIIREEFKPNTGPRPCELCGQIGHELKYCTGKARREDDDQEPPPAAASTEFIFLRLPVLREYLEQELKPDRALSYPFDLERAIDDWVFMCFFVGNDFLPHLPSLEIREGAIDRLIDIYKNNSDQNGGYLTENGFVHTERVQVVLTELGKMEDGILRNRMYKAKNERRRDREREQWKRKREEDDDQGPGKRRRTDSSFGAPAYALDGAFAAQPVGQAGGSLSNPRQAIHEARVAANTFSRGGGNGANMSSAQKLRAMLVGGPEAETPSTPPASAPVSPPKREQNDDEDPNDVVRLGEEGWKQRYYMNKFGVALDEDTEFQRDLVNAYVEGLSWVLQYYYQGCPSWTWYYPYHYSPFASDFKNIASFKIEFPKNTKPFKPLEQLMGVFPAASGKFLPPQWQQLMSDPDSPILDFYPSDFCVDLNGKKFAWQGVALLPFVDEERLLKALAEVYGSLSPLEKRRNSCGQNLIFVCNKHSIFTDLYEKLVKNETPAAEEPVWIQFEAHLIYGMSGLAATDATGFRPHCSVPSPYASLAELANNMALSVLYRDPEYPDDHKYLANRLPNAKAPPKVLVEGRGAQLGFDRNRPRMHLDQSAHRMLNGGTQRRGGRGGGFSDRQNHSSYNDNRRGYNEEPEPRWEDQRYNQRPEPRWEDPRSSQRPGGYNSSGYNSGNQYGNVAGNYDNQRSRHSYGDYSAGSRGPSQSDRGSDHRRTHSHDGERSYPPSTYPADRYGYQPYPPQHGSYQEPVNSGSFSREQDGRGATRNASSGPSRYYTNNYPRNN